MRFLILRSIVAAVAVSVASASPLHARQNDTMVYDFSELTPSAELQWTPCYENFTCSLLEVPLDYTDASVGTTNIGIIKLPSQNASAEDLLINPGGPGGSAVGTVLSSNEFITAKVGTQFNLIGIDPRGVNNSGPDLSCFPGYPAAARNAVFSNAFAVPDITSEYGLAKSFQSVGAYGDWCTGVYSINGTAKYANTVAVVHDFLRYIELQAESRGRAPKEAKLYYYGISYGTIIGATFASLFPDRIARIILDGVMDSEDYYNSGWVNTPADTDVATRNFFRFCFEAGPERCAFHKNATSWEQIEQRYRGIIASLKKSPIGVGDPLNPGAVALSAVPSVVTWQDLTQIMLGAMYDQALFPIFAPVLAELEDGNATQLWLATPYTSIASPLTAAPYTLQEPRSLVHCVDANGRFNTSTVEEYTTHVERQAEFSEYGGLAFAAVVGPICRKLEISAPESQLFTGVPSANETSAPILFIGNTADPATPLRSAKKMSSLFGGSRLLTANVTGHSTFGVSSECVDSYTQQYMLDASLPPLATVCEVESVAFPST